MAIIVSRDNPLDKAMLISSRSTVTHTCSPYHRLATGCWLLAAGYWLLATGYSRGLFDRQLSSMWLGVPGVELLLPSARTGET